MYRTADRQHIDVRRYAPRGDPVTMPDQKSRHGLLTAHIDCQQFPDKRVYSCPTCGARITTDRDYATDLILDSNPVVCENCLVSTPAEEDHFERHGDKVTIFLIG